MHLCKNMLCACLNIHTQCLYVYMQILANDKITDLYSSFLCSVYIIWQLCSAWLLLFPPSPNNRNHVCLSCLYFTCRLTSWPQGQVYHCVRVNTAKCYLEKTKNKETKQQQQPKKTVARLFYSRPWELLMSFLFLSKTLEQGHQPQRTLGDAHWSSE